MWAERNGGSKFWLRILNELKNRGIGDIPIAAAGGLARFPEALSAVFLKTEVQLRIAAHGPQFGEAHAAQGSQGGGPRGNMPCPLLGRCGGGHAAVRRKAGREIPGNLKIMAGLLERGRTAHEVIAGNPQGHMRGQRGRIADFTLRRNLKTRLPFPGDGAATKLIFMILRRASKRWAMPIGNWGSAMQPVCRHLRGQSLVMNLAFYTKNVTGSFFSKIPFQRPFLARAIKPDLLVFFSLVDCIMCSPCALESETGQ